MVNVISYNREHNTENCAILTGDQTIIEQSNKSLQEQCKVVKFLFDISIMKLQLIFRFSNTLIH